MPFYEIEFPLTGLDTEALETALLESGAISMTFLDRGDEPVLEPRPGEIRLWSDTLVRALYDAGAGGDADVEAEDKMRHLAANLSPRRRSR